MIFQRPQLVSAHEWSRRRTVLLAQAAFLVLQLVVGVLLVRSYAIRQPPSSQLGLAALIFFKLSVCGLVYTGRWSKFCFGWFVFEALVFATGIAMVIASKDKGQAPHLGILILVGGLICDLVSGAAMYSVLTQRRRAG